jgi:hypothetical protein
VIQYLEVFFSEVDFNKELTYWRISNITLRGTSIFQNYFKLIKPMRSLNDGVGLYSN